MARKEVKRGATKTGLKKKEFSRQFNDDNIVSIVGLQKRKSWSVQDIKTIKPLSDNQSAMIESYFQGNHIVADGSAGTGKTFLALWLALNSVLSKDFQQDYVIIVRSNISTGKDVGALPGTLEEKMEPYEAPYKDILHELIGRASTYGDMKDAGKLQFIPTAFIRGLTWDNAIIIIDEVQNMTMQELSSVMTRVGTGSIVVACGDRSQNDLIHERKTPSGFDQFIKVANIMEEFDIISFTRHDIVRSKFVKSFICACEDIGV